MASSKIGSATTPQYRIQHGKRVTVGRNESELRFERSGDRIVEMVTTGRGDATGRKNPGVGRRRVVLFKNEGDGTE